MVHVKVDWSFNMQIEDLGCTMVDILAGSSNGRTAAFGAVSGGSNPPPAACEVRIV